MSQSVENDARKSVQAWADFIDESDLAGWRGRALEHRREGCTECLAGRCITGGTRDVRATVDRNPT